MALIIPKRYQQRLLPETTEVAIKTIKDSFQKKTVSRTASTPCHSPTFRACRHWHQRRP